jgi:hypothetical protein
MDERMRERLREWGIHAEPRDTTPVRNIVYGGLGSMAGNVVARAAGLGFLGTGLASIAGVVAGHLLATNRITIDEPSGGEPKPQAAHSDRR